MDLVSELAFTGLIALGAVVIDWLASLLAVPLSRRHRAVPVRLASGSTLWTLGLAIPTLALVGGVVMTRRNSCGDIVGLGIDICGPWLLAGYIVWFVLAIVQADAHLRARKDLLEHHRRLGRGAAVIAVGPRRWLMALGDSATESYDGLIETVAKRFLRQS